MLLRLTINPRPKELDRLSLLQAESKALVTEAMKFLSGLEFTLTEGLPQEKLATLRQCIERIYINKPGNEIKMLFREVPVPC